MKTYRGKNTGIGGQTIIVTDKTDDGEFIRRRSYHLKHIFRHSPNGIQWGYAGSGPADCALSILTDLFGPAVADRWHQRFKSDFIAPAGKDLQISEPEIRAWLEERQNERRTTG